MPDASRTLTAASGQPAAVVFTDPVLRRFLFAVVIAMTAVVAGVAAAAFYTSFEAIRAFAQRSGGIAPQHAWLAPLLVDSFIFVASAADLWISATGATHTAGGLAQRAVAWLPKALLGLAAAGSFALNVAHAPAHLGARVVAGLAPAALVLTFEILMMIVRRAVAARVARLSAHQPGASERPPTTRTSSITARREQRPAAAAPTSSRRRPTAADVRLAEVRRLYLDGVTVAGQIARRLGIPPSTTRRLLSQVKRELAAHPTANDGGERAAQVAREQVSEQRPLAPAGSRPPEPERDRQPPGRALVALTRQGGERP
jgi:Protein of unknown function (DUF2637)